MDILQCRGNARAKIITETALDFWKKGRDQEEIELRDLETSISESAFNSSHSGFWQSSLINDNLVDFFIPFLPLEYQHVVHCVMAEMKDRGLQPDQNVADQVARDLVYFPKTERVFSKIGFKTIASRLVYYT